MAETTWKVGDYAMSRGSPIRVQEVDGTVLTVAFVSDYREGVGITCGGYHSTGNSRHDLKPITDPEMLLRCRAYEAKRRIEDAKREIAAQEKIFAAQVAGLRALQDAMKAVTAEHPNG